MNVDTEVDYNFDDAQIWRISAVFECFSVFRLGRLQPRADREHQTKPRHVITFWSYEELHEQRDKIIIVSCRLEPGLHSLLFPTPREITGLLFFFFLSYVCNSKKKMFFKKAVLGVCVCLSFLTILYHLCPDGCYKRKASPAWEMSSLLLTLLSF